MSNRPTLNDEQIAHRLTAAFASMPIKDRSISGVLALITEIERRHKRRRVFGSIATSVVFVLLVAGLGVATYRRSNLPTQAPGNTAATATPWLIPTYVPNGLTLRRNHLVANTFQGGWGEPGNLIEVTTMKDLPGAPTLSQAISLQLASNDSQQRPAFLWSTGKGFSVVAHFPATISTATKVEIVRTIVVDSTDGSFTLSTPVSFPQLYLGVSDTLDEADTWTITGNRSFDLSGFRLTDKRLKKKSLFESGVPSRSDRRLVTLTGRPGAFYIREVVYPGAESRPVVEWEDAGWGYSASLDGLGRSKEATESTLLRIVESLRPATESDWNALPYSSPFDDQSDSFAAPSTEIASDPRLFGEIDGIEWSMSFADALTKDGCFNIELNVGTVEEKCFVLNDQPIMWSGIRKVGGVDVLVAFLGEEIDAVSIDGADDNSEVITPDGVLAVNGSTIEYLGVVVVPLAPGGGSVTLRSLVLMGDEPDSEMKQTGSYSIR